MVLDAMFNNISVISWRLNYKCTNKINQLTNIIYLMFQLPLFTMNHANEMYQNLTMINDFFDNLYKIMYLPVYNLLLY